MYSLSTGNRFATQSQGISVMSTVLTGRSCRALLYHVVVIYNGLEFLGRVLGEVNFGPLATRDSVRTIIESGASYPDSDRASRTFKCPLPRLSTSAFA